MDYSPLNKVIKQDAYSFPNIAEIYKRLSESGIFSKIDLKAAYHQIPVEFWSIQFTAFICEFGLYEYLSMPMGIKTAPAWFQRFMEATFADFIQAKVIEVYLDDTIVHTLNVYQHSNILEKVFERIKERNIKISYEKSQLVQTEITFLGNTVTNGEIKPKQDRGKCIASRERPSTLKGLQAWLEAANYLRKYIPNFAQITQFVYIVDQKKVPKNLRKKNGAPIDEKIKITWNEEALESFKKLQDILCSDLILALSDFTKEMIITTDASELGYEGHLEQNFKKNAIDANEIRPIEYFSRNYTPTQRKYSTTEKEM